MTTITTPEAVPELLLHHPTLPAACDRLLFTMKACYHELPTPFFAKTVYLCQFVHVVDFLFKINIEKYKIMR